MAPSAAITDTSVDDFLSRLAGADPAPGGGSGAAIIGAMGAALVSMVCRVTLGKKGADATTVHALQSICEESEELRATLTRMVAEDVAVFEALVLAYRLPKDTEQHKAERSGAIQARLRNATEVPLRCARACAQVIHLAQRSVEVGSPGVISDAGVAALAAFAALRSAALNVYINTPSLADRVFATAAVAEIDELTESCGVLNEAVVTAVRRIVAA